MRPARVIAIFDWELSTIGDPLADLGYMTVTWIQPGDPEDTMFSSLSAVTRREGFPSRDELIAHYEERTGRSMSDLNWYQALALWKAAVFMEGNYKRSLAGTTDDPFLKLFDEGVPRARRGRLRGQPCRLTNGALTGLLVDYGGVLTTNVWDSFRAFCEAEGIDREEVKKAFRDNPEALALLRRLEAGELNEEEFSPLFGPIIGVREDRYEGLVDRLFAGHAAGARR